MVYIIFNFLVLRFGEKFMKIRTKIPKLQMHEILKNNINDVFIHIFMQIFRSVYDGHWWAIKTTYILQLYTANFLYVFNQFRIRNGDMVLFFPILVVQMLFSPKFNRPQAPTSGR